MAGRKAGKECLYLIGAERLHPFRCFRAGRYADTYAGVKVDKSARILRVAHGATYDMEHRGCRAPRVFAGESIHEALHGSCVDSDEWQPSEFRDDVQPYGRSIRALGSRAQEDFNIFWQEYAFEEIAKEHCAIITVIVCTVYRVPEKSATVALGFRLRPSSGTLDETALSALVFHIERKIPDFPAFS